MGTQNKNESLVKSRHTGLIIGQNEDFHALLGQMLEHCPYLQKTFIFFRIIQYYSLITLFNHLFKFINSSLFLLIYLSILTIIPIIKNLHITKLNIKLHKSEFKGFQNNKHNICRYYLKKNCQLILLKDQNCMLAAY